MADTKPKEQDEEWVTEAAENIQKGAEENIKWLFQKMDYKRAFRLALSYRTGHWTLKLKHQREKVEQEWQRRVGTSFPGWKEPDLYAVASWAGIPGGDVADLSPYQLYDRAIDAIAEPEQPTNNFTSGRHNNEFPNGESQQRQSEISDGDQQGLDEGSAEQRQASEPVSADHSPRAPSRPAELADNAANALSALEALFGDDAGEYLKIVQSEDSTDEKMRAICDIDRRYFAWDSPQWATLLKVTAGAIRKTLFWKEDRLKAIEAEKSLREDKDI